MAWIELHQALRTHPKLIHLATLLKTDPDSARVKLENLWLWALDYCPNGSLTVAKRPLTEPEIAVASGWNGEATDWVRSLIASGWIDKIPGGAGGTTMYLHDWQKYGGKWCKKRERDIIRKQHKLFQEESEAIPDGVHVESRGTEQDRTGQDRTNRTGQDSTGEAAFFEKLSDEFFSLTGRPSLGGAKEPRELIERIKGLIRVRGLESCLKVMREKTSECVQRTGRPPHNLQYFVPILEDDRSFGKGGNNGQPATGGAKEILRHFALPDGEMGRRVKEKIAAREKREREKGLPQDGGEKASSGGGEPSQSPA